MNIVILDSIILSECQIEKLKNIGDLKRYNSNPESDEEILTRAIDADVLIVGWTHLSNEILSKLKRTQLISLWSTGFDQVDLEVARENNIAVTNVRGYAKNAVAELAIGLILSVYRKITLANQDVKTNHTFNWGMFNGFELTGKTIGVVGTGAIGKRVVEIANGFDMTLLAYDPYPDQQLSEKTGVKYVSFDELLETSDIISFHLPLLKSTRNMLDKSKISKLKSNAVIINTARAEIINQEDMYEALMSKQLLGAGLDDIVLDKPSGKKLLSLNNVVVTPHIGFNTHEATVVKGDICIENVISFIDGRPNNLLN